MPLIAETVAGVRSRIRQARADAVSDGVRDARVALVPTLGALHDGHLALVERARERAEIVVVSIFVNPLQFGDAADLERYPRTLEADVARLESRGVQIVFAPKLGEMYPRGDVETRVTAGPVGDSFEGSSRPGHFDGVLTVVLKLMNIVRPDVVVFGEKDAQQLFLVRRMVRDLDLDIAVEAVPTVREPDGLALSSRNRFLGPDERRAARALPRALEAAGSGAGGGVPAVSAAAQSALAGDPNVELDYLAVVDPATFLPVGADHRGRALVLIAARVGDIRLIDNAMVHLA